MEEYVHAFPHRKVDDCWFCNIFPCSVLHIKLLSWLMYDGLCMIVDGWDHYIIFVTKFPSLLLYLELFEMP